MQVELHSIYISVDIVARDMLQVIQECFRMAAQDVEPEEWDMTIDH